MLARGFEMYGRFCAGHPLEVIVTTFTLTACMFNMETGTGLAREEGSSAAAYCHHNRCDNMVNGCFWDLFLYGH